MKNLILIFLSLFLLSCTTTKEASQKEITDSIEEVDDTASREKRLSDAGFIKATVVNMEGENGCGYLLKTEDGKLYRPLSWVVPEYKEANKVIFVKYTPSKSTETSCKIATPIMTHEMKLIR
jgi:Icc-related predicted phosphoesterase